MRQMERQRKTRRSSDRDTKPQIKFIISDGLLLKVWAYQYNRDLVILEWVQQRASKMMKGLEHLTCEERLRVGTVPPGEVEPPRRPYKCVQISDGGRGEDGSVVSNGRKTGNGHKIKHKKIHLNI